jgi:hypothetical protein
MQSASDTSRKNDLSKLVCMVVSEWQFNPRQNRIGGIAV